MDVLVGSEAVIDMLASKGCSAVLLAGDVANWGGRSVVIEVVACGSSTESSLLRNIQSSPAGGSSTSTATGGARSSLPGELNILLLVPARGSGSSSALAGIGLI